MAARTQVGKGGHGVPLRKMWSLGSERRSEVEEGTWGRVRGNEGWGRLGDGEDGGSGNRELGRLGSGRRHDQGSEKGKGFLVPRPRVPSWASACSVAIDIVGL